MREIKFRAWDKVDGGMLYNANVIGANDPDIQTCWEFMQYTGLKDKNGVEIYEGDMVDTVVRGIAQVVFYEGAFRLRFYSEEADYTVQSFLADIEVIGNIYENKELLEANNVDK